MILIIFYDEVQGFAIEKFHSMEEVLSFLFEKETGNVIPGH